MYSKNQGNENLQKNFQCFSFSVLALKKKGDAVSTWKAVVSNQPDNNYGIQPSQDRTWSLEGGGEKDGTKTLAKNIC